MGYLFLALVAFVAAFIMTKIIVFIHLIVIAPFRRNKIVERGDYKTVKAREISKNALPDDNGNYNLWFKYSVDGKEYKTNIHTKIDNSLTVTLYYHKNPSHAYGDINCLGGIEYPGRITACITIVIFLVLVLICKMNGM